jgi:hypothetical protein
MPIRSSMRLSALGILAPIALACAPKDAPQPNVVNVRASDFTFEAPAEIPAGFTTFKLANAGPNFHHMVIARIDSGKTFADAQAALTAHAPPPGWLVTLGGPNAPDPGGESNATVDLMPGNYVLFCMVDMPEMIPHVARGMIKELKVNPASGGKAKSPNADVDVTLFDYNFALSKQLSAGPTTFKVTSKPEGQPHEIELIRLAPGVTGEQFMKWMEAAVAGKAEGAPPGSAIGGVAPAHPGATQYFTADLTPGDYLLVCFFPDTGDGRPHFMHGMMQTITVS